MFASLDEKLIREKEMKKFKLIKQGLVIVISCVMLCIMGQEIIGQESEKGQVGCRILNKNEPAIFIEYEGLEETKDNEILLEVHLRLKNNTDCPIFIETKEDVTLGAYSSLDFSKFKGNTVEYVDAVYGKVKVEITFRDSSTIESKCIPEFSDGVKLPIIYHLYDYTSLSIKPGNTESIGGGCIVYGYTILPGQSVRFTVDIEQFRYSDIVVPFEYEWEKQSAYSYESSHNVSFDRESLPYSVMKKFNIKSRLRRD